MSGADRVWPDDRGWVRRRLDALPDSLADLRGDDRARRMATGIAVVLGLLVATFHWLGFVVGGALVALPQRSIGRGLLAGLGFAVAALLLFGAELAATGTFGMASSMGQVTLVTVVIPLALGLLGSLARGVW